jgi:hypothetical protein
MDPRVSIYTTDLTLSYETIHLSVFQVTVSPPEDDEGLGQKLLIVQYEKAGLNYQLNFKKMT